MKKFAALLAILAVSAFAANASSPAVSLGESGNTTIVNGGADACASGTLYTNHDGTFENGYAWQYGGTVAPYYGAFGEAFEALGPTGVNCGAFWLSTLPGYYFGQPTDLYVWEGGVAGAPGAVAGVVTGYVFPTIPSWPTIGQFDVDMNINVATADFTVGHWGNWPGAGCGYFIAADLDGFGGFPWTNIAPGIGYPTGWNNPSIVWGPTQSMGYGVYVGTVPVEAQTWGSIKALFE